MLPPLQFSDSPCHLLSSVIGLNVACSVWVSRSISLPLLFSDSLNVAFSGSSVMGLSVASSAVL